MVRFPPRLMVWRRIPYKRIPPQQKINVSPRRARYESKLSYWYGYLLKKFRTWWG